MEKFRAQEGPTKTGGSRKLRISSSKPLLSTASLQSGLGERYVERCGFKMDSQGCMGGLLMQEPSVEHLREALHTLVVEQQELYQKAAYSTLSIGRLHQRLVLLDRYFLAMVRKGVASPEVVEVGVGVEGGGVVGEEAEEVEHGAAEEREGGGVIKLELPESVKKKKESASMEKSGSETSIASG